MRVLLGIVLLLAIVGQVWAQVDTETPTPTPTETETPTDTPVPTETPTNTPAACGTPPYIITTTDDDLSLHSLRWATNCCNGDTINVPVGTYHLGLGELAPTADCTLVGTNTATTIITGDDTTRIFNNSAPGGFVLTLNTLTLTHGTTAVTGGGAVLVGTSGTLSITNCVFDQNSATGIAKGGAIFASGSTTMTIAGSTFTNNSSEAAGAGVNMALGDALSVTNSVFQSNISTGDDAGALYTGATPSTISASSFLNNTAGGGNGGAITGTNLSITQCLFDGNSSSELEGGGAIRMASGSGDISNSTFHGNTGTASGAVNVASASFTNVTFQGNTASAGNNAIFCSSTGAGCPLVNVIIDDGATACGGKLVAGNHVIDRGLSCEYLLCVGGDNDGSPCTTDGDCPGGGVCTDQGVADLINTDPLLNALANNGGPTQTMSLQALSPAIAAGDDAVCAAAPVNGVDQRGYSRPGTGQAHCSIGAFEEAGVGPTATPTETPTPTVTPTPTRTFTPTQGPPLPHGPSGRRHWPLFW